MTRPKRLVPSRDDVTITDEGKQLRLEAAKLRPDRRRRYPDELLLLVLDLGRRSERRRQLADLVLGSRSPRPIDADRNDGAGRLLPPAMPC